MTFEKGTSLSLDKKKLKKFIGDLIYKRNFKIQLTKSTIFIYVCFMATFTNPIANIRAFNRFYTDIIGLLDRHLLHSRYSLAEARIIYEISVGENLQASQIMTAMHIDKSYLSRLLKKLEKEGLIIKKPSEQDARAMFISLTAKGLREFNILNKASDEQISAMTTGLKASDQQQLVNHMNAIMNILTKTAII